MVVCKIHTNFTKSISHKLSPLAYHLKNSSSIQSPFPPNRPTKNPKLLQFFFQHSTWIPQVTPIQASPYISKTCTVFSPGTGHFSYASQLPDKMPQGKIQNSGYTLLRDVFRVVQSVTDIGPNIKNATMVHAFALKNGAVADLPCATSLLTVYSRAKELNSSMALFAEVIDKDLVVWNAMMSACIQNNRFEAVTYLFNRMVNAGTGFDFTTLVIVMSALSNLKCLQQGRVIHGLSIKTGMLLDVVLNNTPIDMYAKCGDLSSSECLFAEVECKDLITWNSIIIGCFYNKCPEKSLWYFTQMASCELEPDEVSISCAMAACTCLQEVDLGMVIHGLGIKLGYAESNHISVDNSLVSFYSKIRDIDAAECLFREMRVKNVISWNAMIKGFLFNGEISEAFYLLREMQFVGSIQPDMATVVTIIPFCAEHMLIRQGKSAHGFIIRREMASELLVINSLINMYSKFNEVKNAEYLFFNMPRKDLIAWNTMISGYAQNGFYYVAQALFKKMMANCSACNLPTLLAIIQSCDSPNSLQFGRSIHNRHIKLGFSNQIFALNSLIHMYITCGALPDALTLFGRNFNRADVTSWNTIIVGCTQKGDFQEVLQYFDLMRKASQVNWNSITLVSVISCCGTLGLLVEGKLVHGLAIKTLSGTDLRVQNSLVTMYGRLGDTKSAKLAFNLSLGHNLCSWNCVISALSQNEDAKKALELFRSLDFEPNEITVSTVLSACTQLGHMQYGKQIHGHVFRFGFHENPFISAALLDMYSNCGRLDISERVFLTSPKKSVVAYNSLISAYGFHNSGYKAIETFQEMIRFGIRPTNGTFTSLLSACSHSGLVNEGRMYYECMFDNFKVLASVEHHVCMVDMLGRAGRLNEAYDFIKKLPNKREAGVWGALLSACGTHGDVEMGREIADILFDLEPDNVSYYVALCNMYIGAGRWDEAVELRSLIQDKQLKKPAGYSLIDVSLE